MKRNAIASRVTTLINANKNLGTYPWQEPFTGDLFRLCKEAFDNGYHEGGRPLLTGDGLRDCVRARWDQQADAKVLSTLDAACRLWTHWLYALTRTS
jgi:hypothetical protein